MASKGYEKCQEGTSRRFRQNAVLTYLKTYKSYLKGTDKYCEKILKKLAKHPSSPPPVSPGSPDSFISELKEEDISVAGDRVLDGWSGVKIEDEHVESHLKDFGNDFEKGSLDEENLLGEAASKKPSRLKRFFTIMHLRSRKPKEDEADNRKTFVSRLSHFVRKEYEIFKSKLGVRNPQSFVPRHNTPVLEDPKATKIEGLIQDVHITQIGIRILENKIFVFRMEFLHLCTDLKLKPSDLMDETVSADIFNRMQDLLRYKLSIDIMITTLDSKLEEYDLFGGSKCICHMEYLRQLENGEESDEDMTDEGHSSKRGEVPQKIQGKRSTLEDDASKEMDHSPAKFLKKLESGMIWEEPKFAKLVDIESTVKQQSEPKVGKLVDIESPVKQQSEPKVGKLVDIESPVKQQQRSAEDEKIQDDEKPKSESEKTDEEDSKDGISNLMRKTSMEDLT